MCKLNVWIIKDSMRDAIFVQMKTNECEYILWPFNNIHENARFSEIASKCLIYVVLNEFIA